MNFIKVKFLKNEQPSGRSYTYKSDIVLVVGDKVELDGGKHGIVVDEEVDMNWVETYGADNIKAIVKKVVMEDDKS